MKIIKTIWASVLAAAMALGANGEVYKFAVDGAQLHVISTAGRYVALDAEGAARGMGEVGAPDLPRHTFMVTIPQGGTLKDVQYEVEWEQVAVEGEVEVLPTPVAMPVTAGGQVVYPEPGPQYAGVYPAEAVYAGEGMISGDKTLQPIIVTPFKWDGTTRTLYRAKRLSVEVTVDQGQGAKAARGLKLTTSSAETAAGEVLILAPHDFAELWRGYAAFRKSTATGKDFTFIVKDTSEIYADAAYMTRAGDYALALHHYIESEFYDKTKCDKQYVILGASPAKAGTFNPNTMIPTRYFFGDSGTSPSDNNQAGDMYYGCMDRLKNGAIDNTVEVWDVGNDGVYWATNTVSPYGFDNNNSVDWTMEIAVTRVPLLERSVEKLDSKTVEVTAAQMMNSFTNRIAWAESASFRTSDRGKTYVGGNESEGDQKGGKDERYTGERYFFDGIKNMFDPSRSGACQSLEWGPRDRAYNIMGKVQPQREGVIIAGTINTTDLNGAYARSGDLATFYSHGDWREYGNLSASRAYQGGGFYSVYATSFSCMSGKYDTNGDGVGITNALCFGEAPIVANEVQQGALITLTSARDGWSGGFGTLSMALDGYFLNALYGLADGTPMNAAQAGRYARNAYSGSGAKGTTSAHGSVLGHSILCGDPLIKVFMMPDVALSGAALSEESVGYVQKLSVDTTACKVFTVTGDSAAAQAAFSDADGGTVKLQGGGKFRTTTSLTVTNAGELVWNVSGGAGRNGITFVETRGDLTCEGTAERYFGPKLKNVGTIRVPGGNVTLDFDTTACDFEKLEFVSPTSSTLDTQLANANTLRTRAEGFAPAGQTIPVVNSALRLQTTNIGGGNAALKETPLFYVTNGVLKVERNPYWGTEYFVRPTYLSDAAMLGEYASFGLGRPDSDGYDLYVDGVCTLGGGTPIMVTGELRVHLEDDATTLTITNALANGHNGAAGSMALMGSGVVRMAVAQSFTGEVVVGSGVTLVLAIADAVSGKIVVEEGGRLELEATPLTSGAIELKSGSALYLPSAPTSGIYNVYDASRVTMTQDERALVYSASSPTSAIAGRFNDGYYLPDNALIYWRAANGWWQNSNKGMDPWRNASGGDAYFVNGRSPMFGAISGTTAPVVNVFTAVSPNYMEVNAPGSTYTFCSSSNYGITPTLLSIGSSATFENPLTDAARVNVRGGTTTLGQNAKSTVKLIEVWEGGTLAMHAQGSLKGMGGRSVKALKFEFSEARTSSERVAIQELRLFQGTEFMPMPTGTIIEDCAGSKIRITGYTGDSNKSHTYEWISGSDSNESLRALIDGVLGNKNKWWASQSDSPTWFTVTFPAAQECITGYNLRSADHEPRNPKRWAVYVSEDGSTFTKERSQSDTDFSATGSWKSGDGEAAAYELMAEVRGMLRVRNGGTLISRGNAYVDVTLDEGAVLQIVGGNTSLFRPNGASYCNLNLPDEGGVYVSARGVAASSNNEVLYGYSLTSDDLAKFTPADNVTLSLSGGNMYAAVNDTRCGPFAATLTAESGAELAWSGLGWTDRYGDAVTWDSSLKHADGAEAVIEIESLASGGTRIDLDVAATLGTIRLTGGSDETLTLAWSADVVPGKLDLSEYVGKVVLEPDGRLTSATEIIAGEDTVLPASCKATLTIGENKKATVMDGAYSGTWTIDASGVICFGGAQTTIPLATDTTAINATVEFAGVLAGTSDIALGNAKKTIVFVDGCDLVANRFVLGNQGQTVQHIMQTGGRVTLNRTGAAAGNGGNNDTPLLLSHWPGNDRYWKMSGGELYVTNGVVRLGWDGGVRLWIGGGESTALMRTKGIRGGSERTNKGTFELDVRSNGVLELGSSGISMLNSSYSVLKLSGGEIRAYDDAAIDCGTGIAMASDSMLSAAAGKTLTVNTAFTGEGALNVAGEGTVKLTNTEGFPASVTVAAGATLKLPDGWTLKDGKIEELDDPDPGTELEPDPNEMYHNKLAAGDEEVKVSRGTYGTLIEVPAVGYYATAYDEMTTLATSGEGIGGSYADIIIKNGNDNDTRQHTFLGWFKVADLSVERILWFAYANDTDNRNDNGYKVCVTTEGKIKIVKTNKKSGQDNGTALYSSDVVMTAGNWAHIAVAFEWGGGGNGKRWLKPTLFVNGAKQTLTGGTTIGSNLNGNTGAIVRIGAGVTAAGIYVDTTVLGDGAKVASFATNEYYLTKGQEEMPDPQKSRGFWMILE